MESKKQKLNTVDAAVLGYIIQEIVGSDLSDQTILFWQGGSVSRTSPPTPTGLRGDRSFRHLRHLPPVKNYSGQMLVNRQGGEVKSIEFI